jgi:hypothetical protein
MMNDILRLALFVMTPFIICWLSIWLIRRYLPDTKIDALISVNRAKPIEGMEAIDWRKTNKAGERKWANTLRGQRRYTKRPPPPPKLKKSDEDMQVH